MNPPTIWHYLFLLPSAFVIGGVFLFVSTTHPAPDLPPPHILRSVLESTGYYSYMVAAMFGTFSIVLCAKAIGNSFIERAAFFSFTFTFWIIEYGVISPIPDTFLRWSFFGSETCFLWFLYAISVGILL